LATSTIAKALGIKEFGPRPLLELLNAYLSDKHLLLLLDNFEQVVEAAPAITELLESCPALKVLVTSRERLHLSGEHEYPVPPLELPDPDRLPSLDALSHYEAVALFVERAQAVKLGFRLDEENAGAVAEICVRLDGLPLAIKLAAARSKLLSPQAKLRRLSRRLEVLTGGREMHRDARRR
jgi:predicted ATPase